MSSLEKLQRTISEADSERPSPKPTPSKSIIPFLTIPVAVLISLWFFYETQDAFCTVIVVIILTYFMMGTVHGLQGEIIRPDTSPEIPEGVDIPEEFIGRPKLYLAFLIEQAAEQDQLARIIEARGIGNDPSSKYDKWDIL